MLVKTNSFVRFLEDTDDPKNYFEITWPLVKIRKNSKFVIRIDMWWLQRQERGIGEKN